MMNDLHLLLQILCIAASLSVAHIYNERCVQCIEINVYFHAVAYNDCSLYFFDAPQSYSSLLPRIEANMEVLNHAFRETPFFFKWQQDINLSYTCQTEWTLDMCDWDTRIALNNWRRLGDFSKDIDIYLGHQMFDTNSNTVGCASFPEFPMNAIMLSYEVLPPEATGLTLAHEVGHWLGLSHVYEAWYNTNDDPCDPQNPGDFVDDTPGQARYPFWDSYSGETRYDSCPGQPGEDSFFNIMNIVCRRHSCFEGNRGFFTEGQVQRMYDNWLIFREYDGACAGTERLLDFTMTQHEQAHQLILFDDKGDEVFNIRRMLFLSYSRIFGSNLCLLKDAPYALVFYRIPHDTKDFSIVYSIADKDSKVLDHNSIMADADTMSIIFLPAGTDPELPMDLSIVYIPEASGDANCDDKSAEAMLEVTTDSVVWIMLFDAAGQGMPLTGTRHCLPKGRHYSVLVGFESSDADFLEISLDGTLVQSANGPFYNYISDFPKIISTIITPTMLSPKIESSGPSSPPTTSGFCFSANSLIEIEGKGSVEMRDLRIGDMVRARDRKGTSQVFERVYSFGHYAPDMVGDFLEVHIDSSGAISTLQLSAEHMVYVDSRGFVPARALRQGDKLLGSTASEMIVDSVKKRFKIRGLYAPFTPSGTLLVNGVVVSSFVAMKANPENDESTLVNLGGVTFSHQWFAHSFEFPHRIACYYIRQCPNETYDANGISKWVSAPHKAGRWLSSSTSSSSFLEKICLLLLAIVFLLFILIEGCAQNQILTTIMIAIAFTCWSFGYTNKKKSSSVL